MSTLIDLNQTVFVPVVDETKDGAEYEIKMTLSEFFKKCLPDFEPEIVDAIPMEWLRDKMIHGEPDDSKSAWRILKMWKGERSSNNE